MKTNHKTQQDEEVLVSENQKEENHIVLFNDNVNTFDYVIDALVDVCQHERDQAEQCSIIVHYKGKCSVKNGEAPVLKPMCEALLDRGLTATIE